jgi:membrane-associated phospholipid phosphatase
VNGGEKRGGDAAARQGGGATGRRGDKLLKLTPGDKVVVAYLVVIALLILIFSYRIEFWGWLCVGHAVIIGLVVLLAKWDRPLSPSASLPVSPSLSRPVASFVHGWYPVALIGITYKELTYLIPLIHPRDFDSALAAIDHRIFGMHPTVWLERFTWPPLTEVLQLTYSTYYFLPIILGVILWNNDRPEKFHFFVFVLVLGFYLSYLGYIAVPAIGPRFLPSIAEAQTTPLTGLLVFQSLRRMLDSVEGITRDCFPSGHTELTLLVLYYARKFHRRTFWWLLPFGVGIVLSTVYLRYHYVVDVVAGVLVALAIIATTRPLYNKLTTQESQPALALSVSPVH